MIDPVQRGRLSYANETITARLCDCQCYIRWSWPHHWVRRHFLPLFDLPHMRTIVQDAERPEEHRSTKPRAKSRTRRIAGRGPRSKE